MVNEKSGLSGLEKHGGKKKTGSSTALYTFLVVCMTQLCTSTAADEHAAGIWYRTGQTKRLRRQLSSGFLRF